MIDLPDLPPATPRPCSDCPWRRAAAPGWLGPYSPTEWLDVAHGEAPIACHQTMDKAVRPVDGVHSWDEPGIRQCRGAAVYRANVCKSPYNPTDAANEAERDTATVFAGDVEFLEHHTPVYERLYEPARRRS